VTTRTQYALRALYDLAYHRRGQAAQAREIAERQQIPLRYLEQILQDLRKARLVEARRGPRGGYALARPPGEVSLADALRAVRGPLEEAFGFGDESLPRRPRRAARTRGAARPATAPAADDVPALVWADVTARLVAVLESVTLQDFVARAEAAGIRPAVRQPTMYFI
jgi:Rrf2 family protein